MWPHPLSGESGESILKVKAWVDGASRGNPGPAGYGAHIETESGEVIEVAGWLGVTTNNVAEYSGLIEALTIARDAGATDVEIISDSELLVKQMLGQYRVKHPNLIPLYRQARSMALGFREFSIKHTLRAGNKDADRLANLAVDRGEGRWEERRARS
jgi:ribonuclease HI